MEPLTIKSLGFLKWFQEDLKIIIIIIITAIIIIIIINIIIITIIIITIILRTLVASLDKPQGLAVVNIIYLTMVVD